MDFILKFIYVKIRLYPSWTYEEHEQTLEGSKGSNVRVRNGFKEHKISVV